MPPATSSEDWVVRELNRLDKAKADKAYVVQLEKLFQTRFEQVDKEIADAQLSFGRDISNVRKEASDIKALAVQHPCMQEEEFSDMNATLAKLSEANENMLSSQKTLADSQTFWSRWFLRGLIGFIGFLVFTGGFWVYSYVNIRNQAEGAEKSVKEVKAIVADVQQTQQKQADAMKNIHPAAGDPTLLKRELKQALQEVLADKAVNQ